jgi:hypothetical protein
MLVKLKETDYNKHISYFLQVFVSLDTKYMLPVPYLPFIIAPALFLLQKHTFSSPSDK